LNKTKFFFAFIIFLFVFSVDSFAQDGKDDEKFDGAPPPFEDMSLTAEQKAENRSRKMQKDLKLTEEQYMSVYFLFLNNINKEQSLRDAGANEKTMKKEMKKIMEDTDVQLKTILTKEQYEMYKGKMKDGFKGKGKGKGPPPNGKGPSPNGPPPDWKDR
jgi:hypothetical protein